MKAMPGSIKTRFALLLFIAITLAIFSYSSASPTVTIPQVSSSPTSECQALFPSGSTTANVNLGGATSAFAGIMENAVGLSLLALVVSFDVIGIGYLVSKIFPSTHIGSWLTKEYWEVTKTVILIVSIFAVMSIVSGLALLLSGGASAYGSTTNLPSNIQGLVSGSDAYLCTVNNQANVAVMNIMPTIIGLGWLKSIKITFFGFPFPPAAVAAAASGATFGLSLAIPSFKAGVTFSLFNSLLAAVNFIYLPQWLSVFIDFVMYLIIPVKVVYTAQILLMPFFIAIGIGFLIPAGLVMRAIPLVRGIGGTLIAFGIGFTIVWPGILILFNAPVSSAFCSLLSPNFCNASIGPSPEVLITNAGSVSVQQACNDPELAAISGTLLYPACTEIQNTVIGTYTSITPNIGYEEVVVPFETMNSLYPVLNLFIKYGAYIIFQFFFLFVADLMIFYAITDSIAKMLGGSIKLSLGRKIKLV